MSNLLSLTPIRQALAESLSKAWNKKIGEQSVTCPSEFGHASYYIRTTEQNIVVATRKLNEREGIYDNAWIEGDYINFRISRSFMNNFLKQILKSASFSKSEYVISDVMNEYEYAIARMYMLSSKPSNTTMALLNDKIFNALLLALSCNDEGGTKLSTLNIVAKKCLAAIDREEYHSYIGDIAKVVALCLERAAMNRDAIINSGAQS